MVQSEGADKVKEGATKNVAQPEPCWLRMNKQTNKQMAQRHKVSPWFEWPRDMRFHLSFHRKHVRRAALVLSWFDSVCWPCTEHRWWEWEHLTLLVREKCKLFEQAGRSLQKEECSTHWLLERTPPSAGILKIQAEAAPQNCVALHCNSLQTSLIGIQLLLSHGVLVHWNVVGEWSKSVSGKVHRGATVCWCAGESFCDHLL